MFKDFFFRLYAAAWGARHDDKALAGLQPYLSANAIETLMQRPPAGTALSDVVIGSLSVAQVRMPDPQHPRAPFLVVLDVESNLTSTNAHGQRTKLYCVERWTLRRAASARSRPPEKISNLGCPSCGAPFETSDHRTCKYCGETVMAGEHDWLVSGIRVRRTEPRGPDVGGYAPEMGAHLPTLKHPAMLIQWQQLKNEDADHEDHIDARLNTIYAELNTAWSDMDLPRIRPFVSDSQFDYLRYWIEAYQERGLQNRNDNAELLSWERVKVVRDSYFDAVTVRIRARGLDFTLNPSTGRVVGGSQTQPRAYSEYWTLLRSRQVAANKASPEQRDDKHCPSCGVVLDVTMAGNCTHCDSHITSGEFDWVLSLIEQDEAYAG